MTTKCRVLGIAATVALALVSVQAYANVLNVDFQATGYGGAATFSGQGGIAATGDTWNAVSPDAVSPTAVTSVADHPEWGGCAVNFNSFTANNLVDSTGAATGVSVTVGAGQIWQEYTPGNIATTNAKNLLRDYLAINSSGMTVAINGLIAGGKYDLALYAEGDVLARTTTFSANGKSGSNTGLDVEHTLTQGVDYVLLSGVVADNTGAINIAATPVGVASAFNGLQISSVPEPSTIVSLGMGLLSLLAYAWKKRTCVLS